MDKPGYTKGPWFLINDHCVGGPIEPGWEEAGCGVAHCGMRARTAEEATANARLIAAAPDLIGRVIGQLAILNLPAGTDYRAGSQQIAQQIINALRGTS